jgi:NAD(P)-dependent dehydrogenase (short-subunit alcohol dehydrogenase family)
VSLADIDLGVQALAEQIEHVGSRAVAIITDQWREMIHTNVMGVLYCTRAALPAMRAQGSGPIVNVSSMSGRRPRAGTGVYGLTKFEVNGFPIRFATKPPSTVSRPLSSNQGSSPPPATTQGALGAQF